MIAYRVPLSRPSIGPQELDAVRDALESGWLTHGPYNRKFEEAFAQEIGVPEAVSVNSCTSALELALRILGVTGEVVIPGMTFIATANAVAATGCRPVCCDVDGPTRNMTARTIEAALTRHSRAVIVVHFAGHACDMDEIVALCQRREIALIEDCAEALGAAWHGRPVGSFGIGCFSFFPTKNITTGEGGMLTCRTAAQARHARALAAHGIVSSTLERTEQARPWYRTAEYIGHNYRLANPLAALGYQQLLRLGELNRRRVRLARRYDEALAALAPAVRTPIVADGATHVYQMYTVETAAETRDAVVEAMRRDGIEASVHFDPPITRHPAYRHDPQASLPTVDRLARTLVTLPLYPSMTDDEQAWVVQSLRAACQMSDAPALP